MMGQNNIQSGALLVAEPYMADHNFRRAVIMLCEHNTDGAFGFILNKPINVKINELLEEFPEFESEVYFGGPVQTDTIHYIHNVGDLLEDSFEVSPGVFWGGNFEKLKFLIDSNLVKPANIRFFVGYSGWSAGQLYNEMQLGSWITGSGDPNYVFGKKTKNLWGQVLENKGDTYSIIAKIPDDLNWN